LQTALPVGIESRWGSDAFPNWRSEDESPLRERLAWPFEGIGFDIDHSTFWLDEWGPRPSGLNDAIEVARRHVQGAPKLIPVCSHRYLPSEPPLAGNPVFSVYQTDIIIYGVDLWNYFENEFAAEGEQWRRFRDVSEQEFSALLRPIRFWSRLAGA
jgi:hypothetical protein